MMNILFIENSCPFCRKWLKIVPSINIQLPPNKQILIKDITFFINAYKIHGNHAEAFDYITEKFRKQIIDGGLPYLVLADSISGEQFGFALRGITTEEYGRGFLEGFFKKELLA